MMNNEKTIRVTKAQRFEDIKAILNGEEVTYGTTIEKAIEVLDHELDLLARKNSGETKKPTASQKENETLKELICEYLGTADGGKTCTEILKSIPAFADYQVQKVSSLMRQLKNEGRVTSNEIKNRAYFSLV